MGRLLYLFDKGKDAERVGGEIAALTAAFDDLEADSSLAMVVIGNVQAKLDDASRSFESSKLADGEMNGRVVVRCDVDDLRAGFADGAVEFERVGVILVQAGDLGVLSGTQIDELAQDVVHAVPACALGRCAIVWSGGEALDRELFVMGRLAAMRIAFAKAVGEGSGEEPLLYLDTMGDMKRAASLAVDGMFDGVCCKDVDWPPVKFASLAQRIAEEPF